MSPSRLALLSAGVFLLAGLLFGVARFVGMRRSSHARAPLYVDVGHRAALLYAFSALVVHQLVERTALSAPTQLTAVGTAVGLFALTIARYAQLAVQGRGATQYLRPSAALVGGTWLLALGEVGAVAVLVWGAATA